MSEAAFKEPDYPWPPRYWWTKRISLVVLVVLLLTGVVWLKWRHDANAALAVYIDSVHALGQPVLVSDFASESIPDSENVSHYLNLATAAITADCPASSTMDYPHYLPMSPQWMAMEKQAVAADQQTLMLARQARQFTKVDWKIKFTSPLMMVMLPSLNTQRNLANHLADAALYAHLTDDDAEAIERIKDLLHASDATAQMPVLVSSLVAIGMDGLAMDRLQVMAPGFRIASGAGATNGVSRQVVIDLINDLLRRGKRSRMQTGFIGERAMQQDVLDAALPKRNLLSPVYANTAVRAMKYFDSLTATANQPVMSRPFLPEWGGRGDSASYAQKISSEFVVSLNQTIVTDFHMRNEFNLVAVTRAARMYQLDHAGQWPAKLDDLVPNYLPQIPADVFATDGSPLKYVVVNDGTRPLVYSVGVDGADQTRQGGKIPALPMIGHQWSKVPADQWRDVSRLSVSAIGSGTGIQDDQLDQPTPGGEDAKSQ